MLKTASQPNIYIEKNGERRGLIEASFFRRSCTGGNPWARPLTEFRGEATLEVGRFTRIGDHCLIVDGIERFHVRITTCHVAGFLGDSKRWLTITGRIVREH
jgi:hypothetical protein